MKNGFVWSGFVQCVQIFISVVLTFFILRFPCRFLSHTLMIKKIKKFFFYLYFNKLTIYIISIISYIDKIRIYIILLITFISYSVNI